MKQNYVVLRRCIRIRELELNARVGIYDHEKQNPQRLIVSLDIDVELANQTIQNTDDIVDYDGIAESIRDMVSQSHIELLETVAEKIVDICLEDIRVKAVSLCLEKPNIHPDMAGVGVSLSVSRNNDE